MTIGNCTAFAYLNDWMKINTLPRQEKEFYVQMEARSDLIWNCNRCVCHLSLAFWHPDVFRSGSAQSCAKTSVCEANAYRAHRPVHFTSAWHESLLLRLRI